MFAASHHTPAGSTDLQHGSIATAQEGKVKPDYTSVQLKLVWPQLVHAGMIVNSEKAYQD